MALIRIQECFEQADTFQVKVSINQGPEYDVTVRDPFSKKEEERLEWYFEEHHQFPFTDQVKAREAATSITEYGERLFMQVFCSDPQILASYKTVAKSGLDIIQIEIVGEPSFHAFHWEALKDPELPRPLALQATIVRKNLVPQGLPAAMHPSPTINLLIVIARPRGKRDVGYRTISRPLVEALRQADVPVQVDILRPGTYKALENHLREITNQYGVGYYHVIHFDVHGSLLPYEEFRIRGRSTRGQQDGRQVIQPYKGLRAFLALEAELNSMADLVEAEELAMLLMQHQISIAILNACQSGKQVGASETSLASHLIQSGVQFVLAMGYSVTVTAAVLLMKTLYQQLFDGNELSTALRAARSELYSHKGRQAYYNRIIDLEDWLLPVVYQNQPQRLTPRPFTPEEEALFLGKKEERYQPTSPTHGFIGRDLDILQIEKRLLTKRNQLLVRGMVGAGKTTLLQHLASWWQTTNFVEQVFYFGYDERGWTRQQIMDAIACKLMAPTEHATFQSFLPDAQQARLTHLLCSQRHLLVLDNLESVAGSSLAILHTLPAGEQRAVQSFLAALRDGQTLVLFGSRREEAWLASSTFADNVYDLTGLDPEAASILAARILKYHQAMLYRKEEDLQKLLKLLDGFPLALEVVLANLVHQTPTEVLAVLQAGDVNLDIKSNIQTKTRSILRCIDYSYSNLSPDAQALLACLAPFTSVIDSGLLDDYTLHLKQQPVLASLPYDRWSEVLQEAQNWGLLDPDPDIPRFLHLQPLLPYFLRLRLQEAERKPTLQAIEAAFRQHYDEVGNELYQLLKSKNSQEQQLGLLLVRLEYENLLTALNLALATQTSIFYPYRVLVSYLDVQQDQHGGLRLGQSILSRLEAYPADKLAGQLGAEFVSVIDNLAKRQLLLKQYTVAEASYQKALSLWLKNTSYNADQIKQWSAGIYHQLGRVAEEQRHWAKAEQYFQQALHIKIESNDRYNQAITYHQLGVVAGEQRHWAQAKQYYEQALQICSEFGDRYNQARTYHQLGRAAQEQQQWAQAEQYYEQALQIYSKFNDRYGEAHTSHQQGMVAQEQRQWAQAKRRYQEALRICVEFNYRYDQAHTYQRLGLMAQEQQQWAQAERYHQQALQIYSEFNDRYNQAITYHQLGRVAQEQRQWVQARDYFIQALEICASDKDNYQGSIVINSLARLWQAGGDATIPIRITSIMGMTSEEVATFLSKMVEDGANLGIVWQ